MTKSVTDIEQSKKLAEILPLESADMLFHFGEYKYADSIRVPLTKEHWKRMMPEVNPCWSLAALLDVLPKITNNETLFIETSAALWHIGYQNIYIARADNLINACVEMIIKLNEKNYYDRKTETSN